MPDNFLPILTHLFVSGLAIDVALAVVALEFLVLCLFAKSGTLATRAFTLVLALGPGACLMLALRAALTQSGLVWVAFFLALSLPLHLTDLARRKI
ncbi:hypothetical protein [Aquidulcibacter sp.]|jgi:hypothetical protein|uniref:hypothetical protein n=1 Tax=Aquidulcibacter sp. TaxID=2052990 RepID=UPI0028A96701|nr:hypothetical protein [Aquidulcibacter sp.]